MKFKYVNLLLIILGLTSVVHSLNYNSSYTDLVYDSNGWCSGMEIEFTFYNETQFENKEEIERNLCEKDEDPEDDNCEEFDEIDAKYKIYSGPIDSLPILVEGNLDSNNQFRYTFEKQNSYLMEILIDKGKYNDFTNENDLLFIEDCYVPESKTNKLSNQTFSYLTSGINLNLENTNITDSKKISSIIIIDQKSKGLPVLNKSIKTIEIKSNSNNYTKLDLEILFTKKLNNSIIETYQYLPSMNTWSKIENSLEVLEDKVKISSTTFGIYSIVEKEIIVEKIIKESNDLENLSSEIIEEINLDENNESKSNSFISILGFIGISTLIIFGIYYLFSHNTKNKNDYHDLENKNSVHIISLTEAYDNTKKYVQKHKEKYTKEQLKQALENANVPQEIINKVFFEEY